MQRGVLCTWHGHRHWQKERWVHFNSFPGDLFIILRRTKEEWSCSMKATFLKPRRSPAEINPEPASECSFSLLISFPKQLHASLAKHGFALCVSYTAYFIKTVVRPKGRLCTHVEHAWKTRALACASHYILLHRIRSPSPDCAGAG